MQTIKSIIDRAWEKLLVLLGVLGVLLPISPLNMPLTFRDSGVFLYIGWRILNGDLPYRDIWDHKPPVIFYLNALGLALAVESRWGVWLLELVSLFIAAYLGYVLIKRNFGQIPAIISLVVWLLSLVLVLQGGNFTTEYTLPLQFFALWLISKLDTPAFKNRDLILIGVTGALAFFTKQTAIGIWVAIFVYLSLSRLMTRRWGLWLHEMGWLGLGALSVTLVTVFFFWAQGALTQFWDAAFAYNFAYSVRADGELLARLEVLLKGIRPLTRAGLVQLALPGLALAMWLLFGKGKSRDISAPLLAVCLLALPVELSLIAIPQKTFPHYFMTLLPVLSLLAAATVFGIVQAASSMKVPSIVQYLLAAVVMAGVGWGFFYDYLDQTYIYRKLRDDALIQYAASETKPGDTVLVWGAESYVNYFARRESPTRFVYQYPLHESNYVTETLILEFLDDVLHAQPLLVIDADPAHPLYTFPIQTGAISQRVQEIEAMYCLTVKIDDYTVYELRQGDACE